MKIALKESVTYYRRTFEAIDIKQRRKDIIVDTHDLLGSFFLLSKM